MAGSEPRSACRAHFPPPPATMDGPAFVTVPVALDPSSYSAVGLQVYQG
jgi:hypothetical protein